jgi:conjugal transfer pilus assembly protein TraW
LREEHPLFSKILLITILSSAVFAKTYSIVEKSFIDEVMERKPLIEKNAKEYVKKLKNDAQNMSGESTISATKSYVYYIDPTYTLEQDIPKYNRYGQYEGVLYKKGTQVNPIKFIKAIPPDIVIFNPCDPEEKSFVQKLRTTRYKDKHFLATSTMCKAKELVKDDLGKHAFMLTKNIKEKFKIKETISIVSVDKSVNKIKVEVFNAKKSK